WAMDRGCQISQPPAINEPARWSADSSTVFFHVREGGFYHYYAYNLATRDRRFVRGALDVEQPIDGWVRRSTDGQVVPLAAATGCGPAEVSTCGPGEARVRQLTRLNGATVAGLDLRRPARRPLLSPEGGQVGSWLW